MRINAKNLFRSFRKFRSLLSYLRKKTTNSDATVEGFSQGCPATFRFVIFVWSPDDPRFFHTLLVQAQIGQSFKSMTGENAMKARFLGGDFQGEKHGGTVDGSEIR